jgi:tRNA-dihydrouridine synthase B
VRSSNVPFDFAAFFASRPAILAPMEDVSDAAFRKVCRARGAELALTEFVHERALREGKVDATRKIDLREGDTPTAIQIYGADPEGLEEAASIAERACPVYIDLNCGCWVPKVARGGAGAGWLKDPAAMVDMARRIVRRVALPVTVKTRIGWGDEEEMPIVDLARRLEDAGVAAITVHCRTAIMGHEGEADWRWAARVRQAVSIPVIVNGDVRSADDAHRALTSTSAHGVMIGRRAIEHPWIFREVRARLDRAPNDPRPRLAAPTLTERLDACRDHLLALTEDRHAHAALRAAKRYYSGYLKGIPGGRIVVRQLAESRSLEEALTHLSNAAADLAA